LDTLSPVTADSLQRVFKTLTDPTRMRLLLLLEREELAVQELVEILGMAQSTVSGHLAVLRDAGLVQDRRAGTHVYYRFRELPEGEDWRGAWELTKRALRADPAARADLVALDGVYRARAGRTRAWFDRVGPEWDVMRKAFNDDAQRARAITRLVPRQLRVADIGTGTGILAIELARCGLSVIGVDNSERMLQAARANADGADVGSLVELRRGDASRLPLMDAEVDAAFAHMVLQFLAQPQEAVREMARVVRPGGRVIIVDFVAHDRDWMQQHLGTVWHGFPLEGVRAWLAEAGLDDVEVEPYGPDSRSGDLPATFIAAATRPSSAPRAQAGAARRQSTRSGS
jgi:ArsR family transcriptional regulator